MWVICLMRGRYVLIVYSNSPHWQTYFEEHVLPEAASHAAILNWSERRKWKWSLPVALFRVFGGNQNFNPLALIFRPFRWPLALRFFEPFKSFRHGKPEEVEALRRQLLAQLSAGETGSSS
jgi:hypothetical protein